MKRDDLSVLFGAHNREPRACFKMAFMFARRAALAARTCVALFSYAPRGRSAAAADRDARCNAFLETLDRLRVAVESLNLACDELPAHARDPFSI